MFTGCVLVCASISWHLFDGVPGFMDSCSYMFQARLFAHGMLSAPLPPEPEFFEVGNTILSDRWYTVYPPGYPAVLALGVIFKISWLVNPNSWCFDNRLHLSTCQGTIWKDHCKTLCRVGMCKQLLSVYVLRVCFTHLNALLYNVGISLFRVDGPKETSASFSGGMRCIFRYCTAVPPLHNGLVLCAAGNCSNCQTERIVASAYSNRSNPYSRCVLCVPRLQLCNNGASTAFRVYCHAR